MAGALVTVFVTADSDDPYAAMRYPAPRRSWSEWDARRWRRCGCDAKLDLPPASDDNRRVLAVLAWLDGAG